MAGAAARRAAGWVPEEMLIHRENNEKIRRTLHWELPDMQVEIKCVKINGDGSCQWMD